MSAEFLPGGQRFQLAAQASLDGFWDWNIETGEVCFSFRWQAIAGYEPEDFTSTLNHWLLRVHPEDRPRLEADLRALRAGKSRQLRNEHRLRDRNGTWRWVLVRGLAQEDSCDGRPGCQVMRIAGAMTDITERKMGDALTGLPNRLFFLDHIERRLSRAHSREVFDFAVLSLAIERFELANESLGYAGGDALLMETSARLVKRLALWKTPIESVVARLAGPAFLVCLEGIQSEQVVVEMAEMLHAEIHQPFQWRRERMSPTAAIGIATADPSYLHPEELMRDADAALAEARQQGRGRLLCYSSGMREKALAQLQMENDLEHAIRNDQLLLHYQPEIDLVTGKIVGFEALVRWKHPERGLIQPGEFIPMAEETGLIIPLGDWGMTEACRQLAYWKQMIGEPSQKLSVSVNLSARQFARGGLATQVESILSGAAISPETLRLEVTESSLMQDPEMAFHTMKDLEALGVGLHMDDFGTGYSSLNHLHRFPFDTLKIDRSFVQGIAEQEDSMNIVKTIVELARALEMKVVAEGIETAAQVEHLRDLGCQIGQGYYFSRPVAPEVISEMLKAEGWLN